MQFHQTQGSTIRPALVLLDTGDDDFVAAPITSRLRSAEFDFPFLDWRSAGLNVPSSARLHKLTVLPKLDLVRKLGSCSAPDRDVLHASLGKAFCPK
jgi:hypothetical protein